MDRGKIAILTMVVLACALGLTSVVYHRWASHGVLAWWGGDMARLIADAPQVEALRLQESAEPANAAATMQPADWPVLDGKQYVVSQRKDVTSALGLDHLRRGLLDDANFLWSAAPPASVPHWSNALVFSDGAGRLVVVFDLANRRVGRADASATLAIDQIATGWEEFFADQFPSGGRKQ
jgi:hypothetical protein